MSIPQYLWQLTPDQREVVLNLLLFALVKESEDDTITSGSGGFSSVIKIVHHRGVGRNDRIVYKIPRLEYLDGFIGREKELEAAEMIRRIARELKISTKLRQCATIQGFADYVDVLGVPALKIRGRDGNLRELLAKRWAWDDFDKLFALFQISHALSFARDFNISPHQDLKLENIVFEDISKKYVGYDGEGLRIRCWVIDWALANGFKDLGRRGGSRPYQAPEQYLDAVSADPIKPESAEKIDVFALGVITFELLTNGLHPIGEITSEVWPPQREKPRSLENKWRRETHWRKWAFKPEKDLLEVRNSVSPSFHRMLKKCLSADPDSRPTLVEYQFAISQECSKFSDSRFSQAKLAIEYWTNESLSYLTGDLEIDEPYLYKRIYDLEALADQVEQAVR